MISLQDEQLLVSLTNFPWNIIAYTLVSFPINIVLKKDSKKIFPPKY